MLQIRLRCESKPIDEKLPFSSWDYLEAACIIQVIPILDIVNSHNIEAFQILKTETEDSRMAQF